MKKLLLIALLVVSYAGNAQSKMEINAKKISDKMTNVMSLSSNESTQAYEMVLKRDQDKKALKEKYGDDEEGFKSEGIKVEQQFNKDLKALVGNEKWKIWADYKKAESEAKAKN